MNDFKDGFESLRWFVVTVLAVLAGALLYCILKYT